MSRTDERDARFARRLLVDYLQRKGRSEFNCEVNPSDPPDLILTDAQGVNVGVEVVRTYSQLPGHDGQMISATTFMKSLQAFGRELEEETRGVRESEYTLWLNPQSGSSIPVNQISFDKEFKKWRKRTRKRVLRHIRSGDLNPLIDAGVELTSGPPGGYWTTVVSVMPEVDSSMALVLEGVSSKSARDLSRIDLSLALMLKSTLSKKAEALDQWSQNLDQRWLLMLNCNPLAGSRNDVGSLVASVIHAYPVLLGFDVVLWSPASSPRTLEQVFESERVSP